MKRRSIDYKFPFALVEEMLAHHRQLAVARTEHEQTNLKRQIDAADRRIDQLVYELCNLTKKEGNDEMA